MKGGGPRVGIQDRPFSYLNLIDLQPNNEKALYRKSKVLLEKYRTEEALGILRRISRLYPNNSSAKADLVR